MPKPETGDKKIEELKNQRKDVYEGTQRYLNEGRFSLTSV